jgi:hypothetical protein
LNHGQKLAGDWGTTNGFITLVFHVSCVNGRAIRPFRAGIDAREAKAGNASRGIAIGGKFQKWREISVTGFTRVGTVAKDPTDFPDLVFEVAVVGGIVHIAVDFKAAIEAFDGTRARISRPEVESIFKGEENDGVVGRRNVAAWFEGFGGFGAVFVDVGGWRGGG